MHITINKSIEKIKAIIEAVEQGYGGTYHNGEVYDRRFDNNASLKPIPKDDKLGIPSPKNIKVKLTK